MIKLKEILTESIPDYFRGYFDNIDDNMERLEKNFEISNTIEVDELAERWGVSNRTIDNRRYRGQGPNYFKIGGKIKYELDDVKRREQDSYISVHGTR